MTRYGFDEAAVDRDTVLVRIDETAGWGRALTVHPHRTRSDELVRRTAARDPRAREKAIQPFLRLFRVDGSISGSSRGVGR